MQDASFCSLHTCSVHCACERLFVCLSHNINYPFRKMIRKQQTFQLKLLHNPYISLIIIVVGGLFAPRTGKSACEMRKVLFSISCFNWSQKTKCFWGLLFSPIFVLPKMDSGILIFLFITQFSVFHSLLGGDSVFFLSFSFRVFGLSILFMLILFLLSLLRFPFTEIFLFIPLYFPFSMHFMPFPNSCLRLFLLGCFLCVCVSSFDELKCSLYFFQFFYDCSFSFCALSLYYCYTQN